jgi:hypothetical protein
MATKRKTVREEIAELREATHHEFVIIRAQLDRIELVTRRPRIARVIDAACGGGRWIIATRSRRSVFSKYGAEDRQG